MVTTMGWAVEVAECVRLLADSDWLYRPVLHDRLYYASQFLPLSVQQDLRRETNKDFELGILRNKSSTLQQDMLQLEAQIADQEQFLIDVNEQLLHYRYILSLLKVLQARARLRSGYVE